ncbi:hypothetical protein DFH06DRAFT_1206880 [Mycena polygramma]|nr:hypothetical protein DFH06DRAFT_1206880 [Mycena polygramma]
MTPSPPLPEVVAISSLAAALASLNIGIPVEDVIKAVHREEEAKRAASSAQATQLPLHPPQPSTDFHLTTTSTFNPNPAPRTPIDPLARERRRRLVEMTKEAFPDGKVPDPFTLNSRPPRCGVGH